MPIIIKRYANRKLYDTEKKCYITLSGIEKYIQENQEIIVYDKTTGEDISNVILTQIILEKERGKSGHFPKSILAGLIKASSDTFEIIRRSLNSPMAMVKDINTEIERRLNLMIAQGKISLDEGMYLRRNLVSFGHKKTSLQFPIESIVRDILEERGIPSGNEFRLLLDEIDMLSEKINKYGD